MKRVGIGIVMGAAAGVCGIIVYELTGQRLWGWLLTGVLISISYQLLHPATGRWFWWGLFGGGIIVVICLVSNLVPYLILVTWPLIGAVLGILSARSGLGSRITGGAIGLLAGLLGIGILPLITLVLLPILGLPTTFDYDMNVLGLVFVGVFIGGTVAWLNEREKK